MMKLTAQIVEVFSSIQGEGVRVGEKQTFVRFKDCNINPKCDYCDTQNRLGSKSLSISELLSRIKKYKTRVVSLTGGEPLLYTEFIKGLLIPLKKSGIKIYLETNGTLHDKLSFLEKDIDYVAMDIKLPSACKKRYWKEHALFLRSLKNSGMKPEDYFVKIVLTSKSKFSEFKKAVVIIKNIDRKIPLVLQPVTPQKNIKALDKNQLFHYNDFALKNLNTVRIIPQVHKIIGMR